MKNKKNTDEFDIIKHEKIMNSDKNNLDGNDDIKPMPVPKPKPYPLPTPTYPDDKTILFKNSDGKCDDGSEPYLDKKTNKDGTVDYTAKCGKKEEKENTESKGKCKDGSNPQVQGTIDFDKKTFEEPKAVCGNNESKDKSKDENN